MVDLVDSFKKLLNSSSTGSNNQQQNIEDHQQSTSTACNNNNNNNNRRNINGPNIRTREKVPIISTNNNNNRSSPLRTSTTNNDIKLNKTTNFNYLPSTNNSTSNPSTSSSSYRFNAFNNNNNQNVAETAINKNRNGQKQFNNFNNFRPSYRRFQSVPNNSLDEQFNLMNMNNNNFLQSNHMENNQHANFIVDTTSPTFDSNYFKQINQQVYQLLMLQNYQINQQHQLIMAWIECQQEWLRLQQSSINQSATATIDESITESNNLMDCPPPPPSIISNHPLNNQIVPGVRANNFWDNFRSQSFQNKLQTSTNVSLQQQQPPQQQQQPNHQYPTFTSRENFLTHDGNVACNNLCQNVCNKNSRSHSFSGFTSAANLIFGHNNNQNNESNKCKNQLKNNLLNTSPYLSPHHHHHHHRLYSQQNQRQNNNLNVDHQYLRNSTNNISNNDNIIERKLSKLISIVENLVQSNNDGTNLNGLKRKKTSNVDLINLPDLREDACECDLDVVDADLNDDSDEDDAETIQDRSNMVDKSTNFHLYQQQLSSSSSIDLFGNGQRKNEVLKNNSKTTNSEIIRPLMPAEGRSATEPQPPPPLKPLKLPMMLSTLTSSSSSQPKTSYRPPITGNESVNNSFLNGKKPMQKPKLISSSIANGENSTKTVSDSPCKNLEKLSNGNSDADASDSNQPKPSVSDDDESFNQSNNGDISMPSTSSLLTDLSKGNNESKESNGDDNVKPLHINLANDPNQRNGHNDSSSSDDDDDIDDSNDQRNEEQQQQLPQHQADIRIHVVPLVVNGNANEVRTSVRLSGDGEQGL